MLTTVGGLWTSLNGVGLAFNTLFSYNLMMSSIIAKMYNFKAKYPEERKEKKKKKKTKALKDGQSDAGNGKNGIYDDEIVN